ncbi:MaoC family dehydratase [Phreatobacter stygius]|uniref:Acyl dehydratase n=1 Tax=Phreatobacter stygius TaxID=1940610 RepID=A0A4D7AXB5_9HYPH|nr:MaoC/PaaZ C-terminal domain-containing protein [Phreatobacter stygius]QCI64125.1 acyl dehydratase [Phreatobacter stygius]
MSETNKDATRLLGPGEYWFEDLRVGDHYTTGHIVITDAHIVGFAGLSGDFFDLHMDDEFARSQGFQARVAHGLLGLAMADGLKNRSSVRIMAVASLGWNWNFKGPILAGDRIGVTVEVKARRLTSKGDRGIATLGFTVTNQHGAVVQDGETALLTRLKPQGDTAA